MITNPDAYVIVEHVSEAQAQLPTFSTGADQCDFDQGVTDGIILALETKCHTDLAMADVLNRSKYWNEDVQSSLPRVIGMLLGSLSVHRMELIVTTPTGEGGSDV